MHIAQFNTSCMGMGVNELYNLYGRNHGSKYGTGTNRLRGMLLLKVTNK
jgi:hypothetical protein